MNIAIIPARIGSKRIKKKNIKKFCGKPILFWPIKQLKQSKIFDYIIVSSDSDKILNLSIKLGADLVFKRKKKLANDTTSTISVIKDVIKKFKKKYFTPKHVACIYPTSVFFNSKDLKAAYKKIKINQFTISVFKNNLPPERSFYLDNSKKIIFQRNNLIKRTQNFRNSYFDAAQFYLGDYELWLKQKSIFSQNSVGYELKKEFLIDINNLSDWKIAEALFKKKIL
jgi:pseudaminic acid cytidylyltransferase